MIVGHICKNCKVWGELWCPPHPKNTIVTCPDCKHKEDISYIYEMKTLEELERAEYERLKAKYGGR